MTKEINKAESFNAAYRVLQQNAEKLRKQEDLDIDGLVPIVEESAAAYRICKERILAVRLALEEHLKKGGDGG